MNNIKKKFNKVFDYFYIVRTPKFYGQNVFKIGKTHQLPHKRFSQYEIDTEIFLCLNVSDFPGGCDEFEKKIIDKFSKIFQLFEGREYFFGSVRKMIRVIYDLYENTPTKKKLITNLNHHSDPNNSIESNISDDEAIIMAATNCKNLKLIRKCLVDNFSDLEITINLVNILNQTPQQIYHEKKKAKKHERKEPNNFNQIIDPNLIHHEKLPAISLIFSKEKCDFPVLVPL